MSKSEYVEVFFRRRWPDGFQCPRCGYGAFTEIATRTLPLYQCKCCGMQTSVTSGTVMHRTRTPLEKWAAALDALSGAGGMNAVELARTIGVTHKVAWTMLRKIRSAIDEAEAAQKLEGNVIGGLRALAPSSIWIFLPFRHYRCERPVFVGASVDAYGRPTAIKIHTTNREDIKPGWKMATELGARRILARAARSGASAQWLEDATLSRSPLHDRFAEAQRWLVRTFHGIGDKYVQSYLNEYCFRWNVAARKGDLREAFYDLLFRAVEHTTGISVKSSAA